MRRVLWPGVFLAAFLAFVVVAVFPTRTYLAQRASTAEAETRLATLEEQNRRLEERSEALQTDDEIERLS